MKIQDGYIYNKIEKKVYSYGNKTIDLSKEQEKA